MPNNIIFENIILEEKVGFVDEKLCWFIGSPVTLFEEKEHDEDISDNEAEEEKTTDAEDKPKIEEVASGD